MDSLFLNQARGRHAPGFFVHDVSMSVCVSAPDTINYIHMILNMYNQLLHLDM